MDDQPGEEKEGGMPRQLLARDTLLSHWRTCRPTRTSGEWRRCECAREGGQAGDLAERCLPARQPPQNWQDDQGEAGNRTRDPDWIQHSS